MKKVFVVLFIASLCILAVFSLVDITAPVEENIDVTVAEEFAQPEEVAMSPIEPVEVEVPVLVPTESSITVPAVQQPECVVLDDFTGRSNLRWYTVNDRVMGGLSDGFASIENDALIHSGEIVTRGGGFSYVGTRLPDDVLVGYSRLQVRLNTYGRQYRVNFADSRSWRLTHQAPIPSGSNDQWQEIFVEFSDTVPTIFSRQVNSEPFAAGAVEELAFILSDGVDGTFRAEIDWIKVCL